MNENVFQDIEELGDLLDAEDVIDAELGELQGVKTTAAQRRAMLLQRRKRGVLTNLRLVGARLGGLNPRRLRGLIPTVRPLYAHHQLNDKAALTAGAEFTFFAKGIGDSSQMNWTGTLTSRHTNIGQEGKLPNGEMFFVYGFGFELQMLPGGAAGLLPNQVSPNDLFYFNNCSFRYDEGQGTRTTTLGRLADAPARNYTAMEFAAYAGTGTSAAAQVRDAVRTAGGLYQRKRPMFIIQGGDKNEQNRVIVRSPETVAALTAISSTNPAQLSSYLYGIWWQHPTKAVQ